MLAKEIKIKNIKKQREFIESQLRKASELNTDGDISYTYIGYIFPEVQKHFVKEGFKINQYMSDFIAAFTNGQPINLFTIKNDVELSDEELKEAENVETPSEMFTRVVTEAGIENPFKTVLEDPLKTLFKNLVEELPLPPENDEDSEHSATLKLLSVLGGNFKQENPEDIDDGYEDNP